MSEQKSVIQPSDSSCLSCDSTPPVRAAELPGPQKELPPPPPLPKVKIFSFFVNLAISTIFLENRFQFHQIKIQIH